MSLPPSVAASLLDGKVFEAELTEVGHATATPSRLVFRGGTLVATAYQDRGFGEGPYTAVRARPGTIGFTSRVTQGQRPDEFHEWSGEIRGRQILGRMVWTHADGHQIEYAFQGRRRSD